MNADHYNKTRTQEERDEARAHEMAAAMLADPRYQVILADFEPAGHADFLFEYAKRLIYAEAHGPYRINWDLNERNRTDVDAYDWLFHILQKKFFDAQVRWRAGEISLPGIYTPFQFGHYEQHVHTCAWLEPITPAEFALFQQYVASEACRTVGFHPDHELPIGHWQNYEAMRRYHDADPATRLPDFLYLVPYPEWYAYYDAHVGRPAGYPFATHSNQRAETFERRYHLGSDYFFAHDPVRTANLRDRDLRPNPTWGDAPRATFDTDPELCLRDYRDPAFYEFAARFDPEPGPDCLREWSAAKARQSAFGESRIVESLSRNFEYLREADLEWPIGSDDDWRLALLESVQQLHRQRLLAALPQAFEDYRFRIDTGLQPAPPYHSFYWLNLPGVDRDVQREASPEDWHLQGYLQGCELEGQPRTLDY